MLRESVDKKKKKKKKCNNYAAVDLYFQSDSYFPTR